MDSRNVSKEYAVLVINSRERQGQAADALAESLFRKLYKMLTKKPSSSVSIRPANSDSEQAVSWWVGIESSRSIKHCLIEEFFFPPTPGPNARTYLLWVSRAALRATIYLSHKLPDIWRQATLTDNKISATIKMAAETLDVLLQTLIFVYVIPLMTFVVIRPLRRMGTAVFVVYFFALFSGVVLLNWERTLPPLVAWISQLTQQVIKLVADSELTFDVLFPVLAGAIFGASLMVVIVLVRIMRWMFRKFEGSEEGNLRTMGEFSYLLEPLYAAKVRDNLERKLIDLNKAPNIQRICVVCEHTGALLAYEVLSRACRQKISTPVYLLTRNLSLAGFRVSPVRSLWLLVDSSDWGRFSEPTPRRLSWHHLTNWPSQEYTVRLTARSGYGIPQTQLHSEQCHWFKGANAALTDRLINLLKLS